MLLRLRSAGRDSIDTNTSRYGNGGEVLGQAEHSVFVDSHAGSLQESISAMMSAGSVVSMAAIAPSI
jgi:hypothetical protein